MQWFITQKFWLNSELETFVLDTHNPESEFNEFEPRLISAKNLFQLSASLNLETFEYILSGTNHTWATAQIL